MLLCSISEKKMRFVYWKEYIEIREVWNDNLDAEFKLIRNIVDGYPYVALDTEFPGTVIRLAAEPNSTSRFHYREMKANVNFTKLIQLGLTFSNADGYLPTCGTDKYCLWQFNFREFNPQRDLSVIDSINLLRNSGIDFLRNIRNGVSSFRFGELLMSSGAVLNNDMCWITFHGAYDFGYLVKILTGKNLPETPTEFLDLIKVFFPVVYDIRHMINFCNELYGGLNQIARMLGVQRLGTSHLAGSDSLLTSCTFMKLTEIYFPDSIEMFAGVIFGVDDMKT